MPKDVKTNVILEHKTKGFDRARRDTDKFNYSLNKIKGGLTALRKEYSATNKELMRLLETFQKQNRVTAEASQKRGAFTQGLAQGGFPVPAMMLQRGPGMGRQMAGMAVGRTLSGAYGMGRAGLGGSFTGVQGLQQFLGSIPLVGGLLAGQVGRLSGYAEQGIGYQKSLLGVSPYLSTLGEMGEGKGIRSRIGAIDKKLEKLNVKPEETRAALIDLSKRHFDTQKGFREAGLSRAKAKLSPDEPGWLEKAYNPGAVIAHATKVAKLGIKLSEPYVEQELEKTAKRHARIREEEAAAKDPRTAARLRSGRGGLRRELREVDPTIGIAEAGLKYGALNKQEALQMFGELMQTGGGLATGAQAKGMRGSSFAAKTLFGVQMGTAGAFLKGGRRGGLVGGMGGADKSFRDAITEGMSLGLSGSEINQWMQQIAQGINNFQQTGIPINVGSITKLATDIGKSGLTATRAISMAQGVGQYIQGIGGRGITSGADLMMLRELGGFEGGGVAGYRAARSRLETMQFGLGGKEATDIESKSPVGQALRKFMESVGGDQATKAEMLQRTLSRWGVKGGVKEFDWLASSLMGLPMGAEQAAGAGRFGMEQAAGRREVGAIGAAGGLEGAAQRVIQARAPNVKKMASIQNQQITLGNQVAGTMQKLEQNAINVTKGFHSLSKEALPALSTMMGDVSMKGVELAETFKSIIESSETLKSISEYL